MRVFRATYKDRQGKRRESAKWYVEFSDQSEKVRRVPGFTDKRQTEELGRKIEKLVACRMNSEAPDKEMNRWLEALSAPIRKRLGIISLIDGRMAAASKPLADHVAEFHAALLAKGNTEKHAKQTRQRVHALFDGCGFRVWSDVNPNQVERFLANLREKSTPGERSRGKQTSNYYLGAVKQFCRWMVQSRLASQSPLEHLRPVNAATDHKRERRALSVDELRRLLSAAHSGPERFGMSGPERALLYWLAVETGLRANELRSLTRLSFQFGTKVATVTVEAGSSKRRRRDELQLRAELAQKLKAHLEHKLPTAAAFRAPPSDTTADMIRFDLARARTAWLAEAGTPDERAERQRSAFLCDCDDTGLVFDFHGLRHTFITNLARSGVHPKVAQQLARHSTITLTMDRYSHVDDDEQRSGLSKLPDLFDCMAEPARMTGTYGSNQPDSVLASCLAVRDADSCAVIQSDASNESVGSLVVGERNPREITAMTAILGEPDSVRPAGIEPATCGLEVRCVILRTPVTHASYENRQVLLHSLLQSTTRGKSRTTRN